jgi:hypothetical protein
VELSRLMHFWYGARRYHNHRHPCVMTDVVGNTSHEQFSARVFGPNHSEICGPIGVGCNGVMPSPSTSPGGGRRSSCLASADGDLRP